MCYLLWSARYIVSSLRSVMICHEFNELMRKVWMVNWDLVEINVTVFTWIFIAAWRILGISLLFLSANKDKDVYVTPVYWFSDSGMVFGWFLGLTGAFGLGPSAVYWLWGPGDGVWVVFGSYRYFWSGSNNWVVVLRSAGGCLGCLWVLPALWVLVQELCTGFEVRVFGSFSGLTGTFCLGATTGAGAGDLLTTKDNHPNFHHCRLTMAK